MIKTLQKKFILTAMTAVSILILIMFGAINAGYYWLTNKDISQTLQMLCESEGSLNNLPSSNPADPAFHTQNDPGFGFGQPPKNEQDTFLSSNFFTVRISKEGNILFTDSSRVSAISDITADEMALKAYDNHSLEGSMDGFRYMAHASPDNAETTYIFLDTSSERWSFIQAALLSGGISLLCWGAMLALVVVMSKQAIQPIAVSMEKQKQFVTNAGHEIKTPLAIIQSNTEAMELFNGENKWTKNIKQQTNRLSVLTKNLLTMARLDENPKLVKAESFDFSRLCKEMSESFAEPLKLKEIHLNISIEPDIEFTYDKEYMSQLVSILFDNAQKYTDSGGEVDFRLHQEGKNIILAIENTCSALPEEDPELLFDRFYRADSSRSSKSGGAGIGLSLARTIAASAGGTITAAYPDKNTIRFTAIFKSRT